ncbi:hypothetical protein ScPMuIL_013789 [Solemya velum]
MSEVPIVTGRANVMVYDETNRKWIPSGATQGLSKVQIYQHTQNHTFRVVGRKLQDHEVVINCAIMKGLKYNQATPTFHQWRDNRQVYGLNFANREDAEGFAQAMLTALDSLNNLIQRQPQAPQQHYQQPNYSSPQEEDMRRGDMHMADQRPAAHPVPAPPAAPPQPPVQVPAAPALAPAPPQAPAPPPAPKQTPMAPPPAAPPAPPISSAPAAPAMPPAAPPPPPMSNDSSGGGGGGGFLEELKRAKLSHKAPESDRISQDSTSSAGSGTMLNRSQAVSSGGGGGDLMSELQKKLQRKRTDVDADSMPAPAPVVTQNDIRKTPQKSMGPLDNGTKYQPESPRTLRKQTPDSHNLPNGAGLNDMESLKQEILTEMRREIQKLKVDIIDAIRQELNH